MHSSRIRLPLVVAAIALLVAACGTSSQGSTPRSPAGTAASPTPTAIADGLIVTDAWVRPPMGPDRPGAGYLTITNTFGADDALIGVSSPVATSVEMHETMADDSGMVGMAPLDRIDVKVGSVVKLEPGGYHLMLMGVAGMPPVGGTVQLTLTFQHAGDVVVQAEVRAG